MAPRDPTAETEPEWESEEWKLTREALINQGKTVDVAVDVLRQAWRDQHQKRIEAWNAHLEQQLQTQECERGPGGERDTPPDPPPSGKPAWSGRPTPNFLDVTAGSSQLMVALNYELSLQAK